MTAEEQLDLWLAGQNVHNDERDECCPDFSCCSPANAWPMEKREEFARKYRAGEDILPMLIGALEAVVPADIYVAGTVPKETLH